MLAAMHCKNNYFVTYSTCLYLQKLSVEKQKLNILLSRSYKKLFKVRLEVQTHIVTIWSLSWKKTNQKTFCKTLNPWKLHCGWRFDFLPPISCRKQLLSIHVQCMLTNVKKNCFFFQGLHFFYLAGSFYTSSLNFIGCSWIPNCFIITKKNCKTRTKGSD